MMLDQDVVAVSPASVYRVLKNAGKLQRWNPKPSKKGTGFVQPLAPNQHWHVDIAYINIAGTFYYLCTVLDGYSRYIVHWNIRPAMTEADVQITLQHAHEAYPDARPRIISDNGPQFIAREFKEFIRIAGMSHVRTSPFFPQSNGKIERWHKYIKAECIRTSTPVSIEDAKQVVEKYVAYYNTGRFHGALAFVTPDDMINGRETDIFAERDRKLHQARVARKAKRDRDCLIRRNLAHP